MTRSVIERTTFLMSSSVAFLKSCSKGLVSSLKSPTSSQFFKKRVGVGVWSEMEEYLLVISLVLPLAPTKRSEELFRWELLISDLIGSLHMPPEVALCFSFSTLLHPNRIWLAGLMTIPHSVPF